MEPQSAETRRRHVQRILKECDWGRLEDIDEWDGEDLEVLREILGEEQYQTLLDKLAEETYEH